MGENVKRRHLPIRYPKIAAAGRILSLVAALIAVRVIRAADQTSRQDAPLPADAAPAGPPPQRFNPTEKVRADFPVSFPIDI